MVIKGNGAVNTMEAVKINTKEKERTKVTYHKSVFSSVLTGITCGAAILALAILVFSGWIYSDPRCEKPDTGAVCMDL